jgi:hypothetical protein
MQFEVKNPPNLIVAVLCRIAHSLIVEKFDLELSSVIIRILFLRDFLSHKKKRTLLCFPEECGQIKNGTQNL